MGRFSQAVSEGDGISVIPVIAGDVASLAAEAEAAGAEALAVERADDVAAARSQTGLPVLLRLPELGAADVSAAGADGCVLRFGEWAGSDDLEAVHARLLDGDLDCAIEIRDEEELRQALDRVDPEIVLVADRGHDSDDDPLEHVLDLLPDVPAGKLVIAESDVVTREQVLALERAGIDGLLVRLGVGVTELGQAVEELVGGARPTG